MTRAEDDPWTVVETVLVGLGLIVVLWVVPVLAMLFHAGRVEPLSLVEAVTGTVRAVSEGRAAEPASAFEPEVARLMPGAAGWWGTIAWTAAVGGGLGVGCWRRFDAYVSALSLARRPYTARGSRRRTWARARDLRGAVVRTPQPNRFTLGKLDGCLLASDPQAHVALIAATRSGKTTRYVIPWLLEHPGPALVTSTKLDVVEATRATRERQGAVWVWDPFGPASATWSPLRGCDSWSYALAQAQWMADAGSGGDSEIAAYWRGEAAKLLAPLLHAASLAGETLAQVLEWVDRQDVEKPAGVLEDAGRKDACRQLDAVAGLDPRNKGTTYMSAGSLLAACRYPELGRSGPEFTLREFFDGRPNTLYVVAGARHQRLLAPLVVGLVSSVLHEAAERTRQGRSPEPTLRMLLDETANIAPLRDLPAHLSQAAGQGVRIASIWQSLAQMHERYGHAADSIMANSTTKLFMGPVTDERTRKYVQGLLGEELVGRRSDTRGSGLDAGAKRSVTRASSQAPAAGPAELQQLGRGRVLVIEGDRKPAVVSTVQSGSRSVLA